jgi:hypothetical protein
MITQALAVINSVLNIGIIYICWRVLKVTKDELIKKAVIFFTGSMLFILLGNVITVTVGFESIGIDGSREMVELMVIILAMAAIKYLGAYYEKKGK